MYFFNLNWNRFRKKNMMNKYGEHTMKMNRTQLYRKLHEAETDEWETLKQLAEQSPWRQAFHIQPEAGLLNDPNGFSFFNGEYHLFYQWFPLGTQHGIKYWYHTSSTDLVHWNNKGIGIAPDTIYDSHGAYSGSAIEKDDLLYLMYTGNTRTTDWKRYPFQCMAIMNQQGQITKLPPVIDNVPAGYTDHFRDPKVWQDGEHYYCVIGAQRVDQTGCAVLYQSPDLQTWTFQGELHTALPSFGYMWECPDYFELDQQAVFLFSPQGIAAVGDQFQNIYQSGYMIGTPLDLNTRQFNHGDFYELDHGFDFYAPQTTIAPDGRRLLVGWLGMPEIDYPTDTQGWAHCLTLPRELRIEDGQLRQRPVKELSKLRGEESHIHRTVHHNRDLISSIEGIHYEMLIQISDIQAEKVGVELRVGTNEKTVLYYEPQLEKLTLDRTLSGQSLALDYGTTRSCRLPLEKGILTLHLFMDTSSIEVFVNDGRKVFTSRIFPQADSTGVALFAEHGRACFDATQWDLINKGEQ